LIADPSISRSFEIEKFADLSVEKQFEALKNVIEIAGGIVDGLGYGQ
jgi:glycerol-3-phosphate dehydrogenase